MGRLRLAERGILCHLGEADRRTDCLNNDYGARSACGRSLSLVHGFLHSEAKRDGVNSVAIRLSKRVCGVTRV